MIFWGISRRRILLLLGIAVMIGCAIIVYTSNQMVVDDARLARIMSITAIRQSLLLDPSGPCHIPELPVNSSLLVHFMKEVEPVECTKGGQDWAKCNGHKCRVKPGILSRMKWVSCWYRDILWASDHATKLAELAVVKHNASVYILKTSDFVQVECRGEDRSGSIDTWNGFLIGIRDDPELKARLSWEKLTGEAMRYNVLIFGFDSLSRNTFMRKLPKSYRVLKEELGSYVLEGYNIVGDGTPQALIPILTGSTELELPDTRKRMGDKADFVDVYPFVWNAYSKNGYVTAFHEDTPSVGIFTYRLKGFSSQPTDHYMRPFYMHTETKNSKWSPLCIGDTPRHKLMLEHTRQFMEAYADYPRFVFAFHGELSHDDYNLVQAADDDLAIWLRGLKESGLLDNTILITMSDHGHRFAAIRDTLQGKQEERLPWFSFTLPSDITFTRPRALDNLKDNTKKLTTPFDIDATLLDVLGMNPNENYDIRSKFPPRSLSVFGPIPVNRTCGQAGIEPHWCACLTWRPMSTSSNLARRLADHLVIAVNKLLEPFRDLCAELVLDRVEWAMGLAATDGIIGFKKTADKDGFLPDLSARTSGVINLYQIKVRLIPGMSLFEASLSHKLDDDSITVKLSDVSRINKYGEQARCIYTSQPQLRKYCYCIKD